MRASQDIQLRREGMVILKPLKVLVCLGILATFPFITLGWAYNGTAMSGSMGLQGEALSADPSMNPAVQMRSVGRSSRNPTHSVSTSSKGYSSPGTAFPRNPTAVALPQNPSPAYCPPQGCPPYSGTQGWASPFTP